MDVPNEERYCSVGNDKSVLLVLIMPKERRVGEEECEKESDVQVGSSASSWAYSRVVIAEAAEELRSTHSRSVAA